jgi:subfamily B ATP-binding cassette protein MsbA
MKLAAFALRYLRRFWPWAIAAAVATLVYAAATALLIPLIGAIFGDVLGDHNALSRFGLGETCPCPGADAAAPAAETPGLEGAFRFDLYERATAGYERLKGRLGITPAGVVFFVPVLFVVVFTLRSLADFVNGYAFQRIGLGATNDLRNDLYARSLAQSSRFHAEHPSGELVSRLVHDVGMLQLAISTRLVDIVQQSVTLLVLLAMLLSIHFRLAFFCLVAAPAVLYPIVRFAKGMRRTSHRAQERTADLANLVSESARGHRVVKAFGMEGFEQRRFRVATDRHLRANLSGQLIANLSSPVIETLGVIGAGAFLIFAGQMVRAGTVRSATLVSFLVALYAMYDPVRKLNKANLVIQQSIAAAQRVRHLLALPVEIVDRPGAHPIDGFREAIHFEQVRFAYDHKDVLRGIELTVRRGEVVAFVGPSGGGKTTLTNLLPRFFDVTGGRVTIDGTDIRDLRLDSLRALIGIVTQETVLFNDTIRNNIAYGRADLPLERVREAARAAFADGFIQETPAGYETVVGEGGIRLSGGQRQRLAIARALLKDAPILILDEATSQLDTESEALVQQALGNLMRDRTTLVVAHRLSTVARADRIYVIDEGRVAEQGSHEELLALDGTYRRLYELQFRE